MARIALIGVLCSAAVCWFAIAWGDPRVLVLLPIVVAAAVGVARHKRGREGGHSDDVELEPAPAEVDEWLARLPTPPEPFAAARPQAVTAAEPVPWVASTPQAALDLPSRTVVYEVREVRAGVQVVLEIRDSFDAAVDAAFELIEERDPPELEIVVLGGGQQDIVWSYTREAAQAERPRSSLELFGFDAERWTRARL